MVIFRRWKVALPLLLIAAGATAAVAFTVKPDYTLTSYVQLIPAKVAPTDDAVRASMRNPWNQLGLSTLGQAAIYATQDQRFLDSLQAQHLPDNFTLTMTYPNPIVTVEVVGKTQSEALQTTALVDARLRDSIDSLQRQSLVQSADLITTQRLDQGQNLVASGGKVKRALAAVAAAGLLMTAGGAVGFDALLRRRTRRREERELAGSPAPAVAATGKVKSTINGKVNGTAVSGGDEPGEAGDEDVPLPSPEWAAPPASMERTAIVVKRVPTGKYPPIVKQKRPAEAATYVSVNAQSEAVDESDEDETPAATNGDSNVESSDVRVVLQPKWVGSENGGKSR